MGDLMDFTSPVLKQESAESSLWNLACLFFHGLNQLHVRENIPTEEDGMSQDVCEGKPSRKSLPACLA